MTGPPEMGVQGDASYPQFIVSNRSKTSYLNPIPTGHGRNQSIYECHVTTAGRNRVKLQKPFYLKYLSSNPS